MNSKRLAAWASVLATTSFACGPTPPADSESSAGVHGGSTIVLNAGTRFQKLAGLGVNGQPRNWGSGVATKPALDTLVREMNATVWRIEVNMGLSNWEATNDDADPMTFNWAYYDDLFANTKSFQDLWAYVRYLNELGVTNIELAAHGTAPSWMGGINVPSSMFDEYVETQMAVLEYAASRIPDPKPVFRWYSPSNEPDLHGPPEGILLDANEAASISRKLADRIAAESVAHPELAAIQIVAPEVGTEAFAAPGGAYRAALTADGVLAPRLAAVSHHRYGPTGITADWNGQAVPEWLTETNADGILSCGSVSWGAGYSLANRVLDALLAGNQTVLVWTEYDAPHSHDNDAWRTMGLLSTDIPGWGMPCGPANQVPSQAQLDSATYSKKSIYHAFRQFAAFVQPGAQRIQAATTDTDLRAVGILNPDGSPAVLGINTGTAGTVSVQLAGLSSIPVAMTLWSTTETAQWVQSSPVLVANGAASFNVPTNSIFAVAPTPGTACTPLDAGAAVFDVALPGRTPEASFEAAPEAETSTDAGAQIADAGPELADAAMNTTDAVMDAADASADVMDALPEVESGATRVLVGEPTVGSVADSVGSGKIEAFPYTAAFTGNAKAIGIYLTVAGRAANVGIYTDHGGTPQTLLASGSFTSVTGWNTVPIPSTNLTAQTNYWIGVLSTNGTISFVEKSGTGGAGSITQGTALTSLPSTWTTSGQQQWSSSGMSAFARE